ncbi:Subtilisin-like protease [Paramyrothecium foliicola]|nr:Subtilisin-like protease [Paramyrothecium foliicola]
MAKTLFYILLTVLLGVAAASTGRKETFLVLLSKDAGANSVRRRALVEDKLSSVSAKSSDVIYHYENAANGFAAKLSEQQAADLRSQPDVIAVIRDKIYKVHTSRTPQFLGIDTNHALLGSRSVTDLDTYLQRRDTPEAEAEQNIIIGILDTGVWPERDSFDDTGMGEVPARWRGTCEEGQQFNKTLCNRKLIGARWFIKGYLSESNSTTFNFTGDYMSPRDGDGHGTHTSSTAAGSAVANASLFGQALGTAYGMAKHARLAHYKVCWPGGCSGADSLAAMDAAIQDGVNILSLSLGGEANLDISDGLNLGSWAAMEKGIFVSMSGGNSGPAPGTVSNISPWIMTVGASTLDRDFPAVVSLGNGNNYTGTTLYADGSVADVDTTSGKSFPLVLGADAGKGNATAASLCLANSLDAEKVAGKIVVCVRGTNGRVEKGGIVKLAGGSGMVLVNAEAAGEEVLPDAHIIPAVHIGFKEGSELQPYAKTEGATAILDFVGTRLGVSAPSMAGFSSRGPNIPIPRLLKPDITGPGVSVLAAWGGKGPTGLPFDNRQVDFSILSGTSMSCPHLTGIVAFIMARRPEWSPEVIRSAIMTTAYTTEKGSTSPMLRLEDGQPADAFAYGNGHVDPIAALNPGLVYELAADDYRDFLCAYNSSAAFTTAMTRSDFICTAGKEYDINNLNYPSFSAWYDLKTTNGTYTTKFQRTVTNLGGAGTYQASVTLNDPGLVKISLDPETLTFNSTGEKQSYVLTVTMQPRAQNISTSLQSSGRLTWSDGKHIVGSSLGFLWASIEPPTDDST